MEVRTRSSRIQTWSVLTTCGPPEAESPTLGDRDWGYHGKKNDAVNPMSGLTVYMGHSATGAGLNNIIRGAHILTSRPLPMDNFGDVILWKKCQNSEGGSTTREGLNLDTLRYIFSHSESTTLVSLPCPASRIPVLEVSTRSKWGSTLKALKSSKNPLKETGDNPNVLGVGWIIVLL